MADPLDIFNQLPPKPLIAIGGFLLLRKPVKLIERLIEFKPERLTILSLSGSFEIDLMLKSGLVDEVISPYVGAESIAPVTPIFKEMCRKQIIIAEPWDTALLVQALKASVNGEPFTEFDNLSGTDIPHWNRRLAEFPKTSYAPAFVRFNPIKPDLALIHASYCDNCGNACFVNSAWGDILIAKASERLIVSVEEYRTDLDLTGSDNIIPREKIDLMIEIKGGAKPFSSPGYYDADSSKLRELNDFSN